MRIRISQGDTLLFLAVRGDFRIDYFRAGGKGGQHQNKTDSGCRITHLATSLSAESRSERSQHRNRKIAFERLAQLLTQHALGEQRKERYGAPNRIIRTYHEPDDRVVDHDTGKRYSYRQTVGRGRIEQLIDDRRSTLPIA